MMLNVDANCGYGLPHGDEKPDEDGDGSCSIPARGDGDGDRHGKVVMGTGMGGQYPPG